MHLYRSLLSASIGLYVASTAVRLGAFPSSYSRRITQSHNSRRRLEPPPLADDGRPRVPDVDIHSVCRPCFPTTRTHHTPPGLHFSSIRFRQRQARKQASFFFPPDPPTDSSSTRSEIHPPSSLSTPKPKPKPSWSRRGSTWSRGSCTATTTFSRFVPMPAMPLPPPALQCAFLTPQTHHTGPAQGDALAGGRAEEVLGGLPVPGARAGGRALRRRGAL